MQMLQEEGNLLLGRPRIKQGRLASQAFINRLLQMASGCPG